MRIFKIILILVFGFLVAPNIFGGVRAAILKFNQNSVSANANEVFTVDVVVDAGSDQILATDAYVVYDSALLEAQKVDNGSFYNTVFNSNVEVSRGIYTIFRISSTCIINYSMTRTI